MLDLMLFVFSILVDLVGLHFMYLGIKRRYSMLFYEGCMTFIISLIFSLTLFI